MKMKTIIFSVLSATAVFSADAAPRTAPWSKEKAWEWYNAQPWIRGCNYMPASAANRVDQWQELGAEERFAEMDRELAVAESIGFIETSDKLFLRSFDIGFKSVYTKCAMLGEAN